MNALNKNTDPVGLLPKVFSGEANPEEKSIVNDWLEADPLNHAEYEAFARLWNITSPASEEGKIDLDAEWHKMNAVISPARRVISIARLVQIAASVIFISALAFISLKLTGPVSEKAPVTEISTTKLPDGTIVSLNAGSKITYKKGFGKSHRSLALKGEAYFEVMKGATPFIISAGEASVRVTGTKFNVKAYSGKPLVKVTVTEGTVVLYENDMAGKEAILKTGETGTYDKSRKAVDKQATSDLNDLAWKTGIMDKKIRIAYPVSIYHCFYNSQTITHRIFVFSCTYNTPVSYDAINIEYVSIQEKPDKRLFVIRIAACISFNDNT